MSTFGQACLECHERPATRTDGRCFGCGLAQDENPGYGPGNPDWERDFAKTCDEVEA